MVHSLFPVLNGHGPLFNDIFNAKYNILNTASSLGKEPRFLVTFRSDMLFAQSNNSSRSIWKSY